jgi:hypothetical protein
MTYTITELVHYYPVLLVPDDEKVRQQPPPARPRDRGSGNHAALVIGRVGAFYGGSSRRSDPLRRAESAA